jgi:hypothetical protein
MSETKQMWDCVTCDTHYETEDDAATCCGGARTVWVCETCDEGYRKQEDAEKCCVEAV